MKATDSIRIESLRPEQLQDCPVWQYCNSDEAGETLVRPVRRLPVANLAGRVVGTPVRLRNGLEVWALLGNVDPANPLANSHMLTLSVYQDGRWFTMARYHDYDFAQAGPDALAAFIGLAVDEVFPIRYDVRAWVKGVPEALANELPREPKEKLSRAEIIAMAVP